MPLPMFPTESGAPGDGNLLAIHGGSPATTEVIGGLVHFAQAVELYSVGGLALTSLETTKGHPLLDGACTVWVEGSLNLDIRGDPTVSDYADMLSRWDMVRAKLLLTDYELFLYYHPSSPTKYRKLKTMNTYLLRSFWNNPTCMHYVFAAVTTDQTLYTTGPGL